MSNAIVIPSSPADLKKIRDALKEASNSLTRIESEQEFLKELKDELHDSVGLPKPVIGQLIKRFHAQDAKKVQEEQDEFFTLYDKIMTPG